MNRSGSRYRFSVEFIDYKYTGANKTPSLHSQMKSLQKSSVSVCKYQQVFVQKNY